MAELPTDPFLSADPELERLEGGRLLLRQLARMETYGDVCRAIYALPDDDLRAILLFMFSVDGREESYYRL